MTAMTAIIVALLFAQQPPSDLSSVLDRATQYVAQYEAELGNLIGSEEYVQNSSWVDNSTPPRVSKKSQRRTSSDFLIIQVGTEWSALRKVNRVDGLKVKQSEPSFEEAFDDSPQANAKRFEDMKKESTAQNLGDVRREINLPTFALHVLRKSEVGRFSFEHAGTSRIEGVRTWTIRFHERTDSAHTLVVGGNGENLYSHGTIWIDPDTGRVLQTEFEVENPGPPARIKARILVTYAQGKKVSVLLPDVMVEHYDAPYNTIDCRADYSNFRPFEVDVKFEIAPPRP